MLKAILLAMIRRPVAVGAFYLCVTALAAVALARLPVALLPSLRYPSLVVWTGYDDVAPEQVEKAVTERVEAALAAVAGTTSMVSRSQLGGSSVQLYFSWSTDLDRTLLDAREKLDRIAESLPEEADRPLILRIDPSERPLMVLAVEQRASAGVPAASGADQAAALARTREVARDVLARRLEQLAGVARVRVNGGFDREIEVAVDPARMQALQLDFDQLAAALQGANVALAGGLIRQGPFRYSVEVRGELTTVPEVAATVITPAGRPPVRLHEIARVAEVLADRRGLVRLDGREVLMLIVDRRPDANAVAAADEVKEALAKLRRDLPDLVIEPIVDDSVAIRAAIDEVVQALIFGAIFSVVVLLLFLRSGRALWALGLSVPAALALALIGFELAGISFNQMSLAGLALGVGLLVDNAIVVMENISQHRARGKDGDHAAAAGAAEMALPVLAGTLTMLAVFLPLTLVEGLAGRLFRDQSLAIVFSVAASFVVAITLVPLIARKIDNQVETRGAWFYDVYHWVFVRCLRHPARVFAVVLALLAATALLAARLPRTALPPQPHARLEVALQLPPETDLPLLAERVAPLEAALRRLPGVAHVLADLGERDDARLELEPRPPYRGDLLLTLEPGHAAEDLLARVGAEVRTLGLEGQVRPAAEQIEALLDMGEGADLALDLRADRFRPESATVDAFLAALRREPEIAEVARPEAETLPAYALRIDRDQAARLGVEPGQLEQILTASARGVEATQLKGQAEEIPILLRQRASSLDELLDARVQVGATWQRIGQFFRVEAIETPAILRRVDQAPISRLLVRLAPGASIHTAEAAIARAAAGLPPDVRVETRGENTIFADGLSALGWSLLLSALLIYLILAAQFESLVLPLLILAVIPFAFLGVTWALWLGRSGWNLMSLTGAVVLLGIAVNDAIVKIDALVHLRAAGCSPLEAVERAGRDRLRPILMNTFTTMLGLLPLAFGFGTGGQIQAPVALAIAGGLGVATLMAIWILPLLYLAVVRIAEGR
jgi:HAE1 family hydrophobic/amphiphilic exporter-1